MVDGRISKARPGASGIGPRMKRPKALSGRARSRRVALARGPAPVEDEIYRLVTEAIIAKQIRPGGRLKEAALANRFGCSRARVRRVLQRLSDLEVVEFRLNFGAFVSRPSPAEARAVFATRRLLEAEAVRLTGSIASPADFDGLRKFVSREAQAFERGERGLPALSSRFHLLLGEMCGNPVLAKILNQLVHRCVLIQALYERQNQHTICLVHEHAELINLMQQGHLDDAVAAMVLHLDHVEASLDYETSGRMDGRLALSIEHPDPSFAEA
jgi:DNA-binding GntR family transcriptional regulator